MIFVRLATARGRWDDVWKRICSVPRSIRIAAEASTPGTGIGSPGVDRLETNGDGEPLGGTGVGGGAT